MMTLTRLLAALALPVALFGCGTTPQLPTSTEATHSWEQYRAELSRQQHWAIVAKLGIRQDQDIRSANLNWNQQQDRYQIFMTGPLGQGAINIRGSGQGVTLQISGEGSYMASSPEDLLQQRLGWSLPLSNLHYWVIGIPSPDSPHRKTLDEHNRLKELEQDSWRIQYRSYQQVESTDLPRKLILSQGDFLRVTLIIKEWNLRPQAG